MPAGSISVALAECLVEAGELGRADELLSAVELDAGADALAALTRLEWILRVRPQEARWRRSSSGFPQSFGSWRRQRR